MFGTEAIIGIISLVISAASTAFGIVSQTQQAKAQAEMQRAQAKMQAESLEEQAKQEEQDQLERSLVERRQNARKLAAAETQYAAAGVSLAGTPTLSLTQMSEENEMEVLMQEASSNRKRNLLLTDAWNTKKTGFAQASYTNTAGKYGAIGKGLSGTSDLLSKGYGVDKGEGVF